MNVLVNGEGRRLEAGTTVAGLLRDLELEGKPVAVEINGATVAKGAYPRTELVEGDRVEIVGFVGGG
jgi:thiamine biosynthesis protein ThiS